MDVCRNVACLIPVLAVSAAAGQTIVWTGAVGNRWDDARNWQPERLPGPEDDVLIGPGVESVGWIPRSTVIGGLTLARRLVVFGETLTIDGNILLVDGQLEMQTFFNIIPFAATRLIGNNRLVTGKGTVLLGGTDWSSLQADGDVVVDADVVIRCASATSLLRGRSMLITGTVVIEYGTVYADGVANFDEPMGTLTGGSWIFSGSATQYELPMVRSLGASTLVDLSSGARYKGLTHLARNDGTLRIARFGMLSHHSAAGPDFVNNGEMSVGGSGRVSINGVFRQTAAGVLDIESAPGAPAFQNVVAPGGFDLGGTLRVRVPPAVVLGANEVHLLLGGATVSGRFDHVDFEGSAPAGPLHVTYTPTSVVLVTCYANCDASPTIDVMDYLCFAARFAAGDVYACDCDTSTGPGVCDVFDFICFGNRFAQGCD